MITSHAEHAYRSPAGRRSSPASPAPPVVSSSPPAATAPIPPAGIGVAIVMPSSPSAPALYNYDSLAAFLAMRTDTPTTRCASYWKSGARNYKLLA